MLSHLVTCDPLRPERSEYLLIYRFLAMTGVSVAELRVRQLDDTAAKRLVARQ